MYSTLIEFDKHYTEQNKPDTKGYLLSYNYMNLQEK